MVLVLYIVKSQLDPTAQLIGAIVVISTNMFMLGASLLSLWLNRRRHYVKRLLLTTDGAATSQQYSFDSMMANPEARSSFRRHLVQQVLFISMSFTCTSAFTHTPSPVCCREFTISRSVMHSLVCHCHIFFIMSYFRHT